MAEKTGWLNFRRSSPNKTGWFHFRRQNPYIRTVWKAATESFAPTNVSPAEFINFTSGAAILLAPNGMSEQGRFHVLYMNPCGQITDISNVLNWGIAYDDSNESMEYNKVRDHLHARLVKMLNAETPAIDP